MSKPFNPRQASRPLLERLAVAVMVHGELEALGVESGSNGHEYADAEAELDGAVFALIEENRRMSDGKS